MDKLYFVDQDGEYLSIWNVYISKYNSNQYTAGEVIFSTDTNDFYEEDLYGNVQNSLYLSSDIIIELFNGSLTQLFISGEFK